MRHTLLSAAVLPLLACHSGSFVLADIESAKDVREACEEYEPEEVTLEVVFPAQTESCPWEEGDNIAPVNGFLTARVEQVEGLEMPDDAVICDLGFDFAGLVPGEIQVMVYDDHFFFTFNDIVLAASYGPAVELLEDDQGFRAYDWSKMVGLEYHVTDEYDPYCLGQNNGDSECEIPDTEVEGPISLSYGEDVVSRLSFLAIEEGRYDFGFVSTGDDNPETDCMHEEFGFTVKVPYLAE